MLRYGMETVIRSAFSFLAAAVTLAMAQEWLTWAHEQRIYWKYLPGVILLGFSAFEAHQIWRRVDALISQL